MTRLGNWPIRTLTSSVVVQMRRGFRESRRVELAVPVLERDEVEAGKITRRVVQEHVLRAVVHDDAVGDKVMGIVLGEIVDRRVPSGSSDANSSASGKRIRAADRRVKLGKRARFV